jgi:hypothetical protein
MILERQPGTCLTQTFDLFVVLGPKPVYLLVSKTQC